MFHHFELVLRWNRVLNLTRIEDTTAAVDRHYAESIFLAGILPAGPLRIVDIGSGAGFPGFPVAAMRPESRLVLVESHQRKCAFLREAGDQIRNVTVRAERIEAVCDQFDVAISRAVQISDFLTWARSHSSSLALLTTPELASPLKSELEGFATHPIPWAPEHTVVTGKFHVEQG